MLNSLTILRGHPSFEALSIRRYYSLNNRSPPRSYSNSWIRSCKRPPCMHPHVLSGCPGKLTSTYCWDSNASNIQLFSFIKTVQKRVVKFLRHSLWRRRRRSCMDDVFTQAPPSRYAHVCFFKFCFHTAVLFHMFFSPSSLYNSFWYNTGVGQTGIGRVDNGINQDFGDVCSVYFYDLAASSWRVRVCFAVCFLGAATCWLCRRQLVAMPWRGLVSSNSLRSVTTVSMRVHQIVTAHSVFSAFSPGTVFLATAHR